MRKIFVFMMVSLDGYFEGPNHELDWHNVDSEFNDFAGRQLNEVDTLMFGRLTYEVMASYWPTPTAIDDDSVIADKMNGLPKIVFSHTLQTAYWNNTKVISDNAAQQVAKLKTQPGKNIAILGSSNLTVSLASSGLVDEFRIMVNPTTLGNGNSVFQGLRNPMKLTNTSVFSSGNVLLSYQPA